MSARQEGQHFGEELYRIRLTYSCEAEVPTPCLICLTRSLSSASSAIVGWLATKWDLMRSSLGMSSVLQYGHGIFARFLRKDVNDSDISCCFCMLFPGGPGEAKRIYKLWVGRRK